MSSGLPIRFNPSNDGLAKVLGPLETDIMRVVWRETSSTVKQVHEQLSRGREIAYTTVMTTMRRLADKGILHRHREGAADIYAPAYSEEELVQLFVHEVLESLMENHSDKVVEHMVDYLADRSPSQLQRILDKMARLTDLDENGDEAEQQ
jgi:predicted transcriptional regulator